MTEQNEFQFYSWGLTPPSVIGLVVRGHISAKEHILLIIIHSLSQSKEGCYASNAYLGRSLKVTPKAIEKMLRKLKGLGLVLHQYDPKTQVRLLKTTWSDLEGTPRPTEGGTPRPQRPPNRFPKGNLKKGKGKSPAGDVSTPVFITNGSNGLGYAPEQQDTLELLVARDFKSAIKEHRPGLLVEDWKPSVQAKHFVAIAKTNGWKYLNQVLEWYRDQLSIPKFRPLCSSPQQFRKHWVWIQGLYDAANPPEAPHIEVSSQVAAIAAEWDYLDIKGLPGIIQRAMDQYMDFMEWACDHYDYIDRDYGEKIRDAGYFAEYWAEFIGKDVEWRKRWNGNTQPYEFHLEHPEFYRSWTEAGYDLRSLKKAVKHYRKQHED